MLLKRSRLDASIKGLRRPLTFMHTVEIVLFFLLISFTLFLLYPKNLLTKAINMESYDELTVKYLENFYRANHRDIGATLALAKIFIYNNELQKAQNLLEPFVNSIPQNHKKLASSLICELYIRSLNLKEQRWHLITSWKNGATNAGRILLETSANEEEVLKGTSCLLATNDYDGLLEAIGNGKITSTLALEKVASMMLSSMKYELSAKVYFVAMKKEKDSAKAKKLYWRGVDALLASSDAKKAFHAACLYKGNFSFSKDEKLKIAKLALAAGEPKNAEDVIIELLGGKF